MKPACLMSKATSVPDATDKSFTVFFGSLRPLRRLINLIVESKSQPVELDNSTFEIHVPSRRKKSLQSYCSVPFDFPALMRFGMTFDVTLRYYSSFGKRTNSCN